MELIQREQEVTGSCKYAKVRLAIIDPKWICHFLGPSH